MTGPGALPTEGDIAPPGDPVLPDFGEPGACVVNNDLFCFGWFAEQFPSVFLPALVDHLIMTAIAVAVGFVIAFSAAVLAYRRRWLTAPLSVVTTFLYTLPPLALFQLLVPLTGLTLLTVEIALVAFTLVILFRAVLAGLLSVPADAKRAASGMGLTARQVLWRVEVPMAAPSIFSGLRIATVLTVSVATIAAFVVDAGLGSPILKAISSPFNTQFIGAGALAVLLAFALDGLLALTARGATAWARVRQ